MFRNKRQVTAQNKSECISSV